MGTFSARGVNIWIFYNGRCKFIYDWKLSQTVLFSHNFGTFRKFSEQIEGEVTRMGIELQSKETVKSLMHSGVV